MLHKVIKVDDIVNERKFSKINKNVKEVIEILTTERKEREENVESLYIKENNKDEMNVLNFYQCLLFTYLTTKSINNFNIRNNLMINSIKSSSLYRQMKSKNRKWRYYLRYAIPAIILVLIGGPFLAYKLVNDQIKPKEEAYPGIKMSINITELDIPYSTQNSVIEVQLISPYYIELNQFNIQLFTDGKKENFSL